MTRALFLDRDGTLIVDVGYPRDPDLVELLPGATEALQVASGLGYRLVIVSNQSGVARGLIQRSEARSVHERVALLFGREGVTFDAAYFCFHAPADNCACRKPKPGMLLQAKHDLGLDLGQCLMVGDKASDVEAGVAAGARAFSFGEIVHPGAIAGLSSWANFSEWLRAEADGEARKG